MQNKVTWGLRNSWDWLGKMNKDELDKMVESGVLEGDTLELATLHSVINLKIKERIKSTLMQLKVGMSQDEVQTIMGKPERREISSYGSASWFYEITGITEFKNSGNRSQYLTD